MAVLPQSQMPAIEFPDLASMYLKGRQLRQVEEQGLFDRQMEQEKLKATQANTQVAQRNADLAERELDLKTRQFDQAAQIQEQINQVIGDDPTATMDPAITAQISKIYATSGDSEEARQWATLTLNLDKEDPQTLSEARQYVSMGMNVLEKADPAQFEATRQRLIAEAPQKGRGLIETALGALSPESVSGDDDSASRYTPQGPYVNENGELLGEGLFDRKTGQRLIEVPGGGRISVPAGARPMTESSLVKDALSGQQMRELDKEMRDASNAIEALKGYWGTVKDSREGWELLADKFIGEMNTIFGKDITPDQFKALVSSGQIQKLLGRFREEVVGGGVMTEQDALRVLEALGGDISATRNKQVVARLLRDIMKEKVARYNQDLVPTWNAQLKIVPRPGKAPKRPMDINLQEMFAIKAPPEALEYLRNNPQYIDAFIEKYGYDPNG